MVGRGGDFERHSFPDGNTGFTRHIVKILIPEAIPGPPTLEAVCRNRVSFSVLDRPANQVRIRLQSTAVSIEHEGEPEKSAFVRETYMRNGKIYLLKAHGLIMAGGAWITNHVVRALPSAHRDAYNHFLHSPLLVANL